MDEVRQIAEAYFECASDDIKNEAQNFFNEMDSDGDECVSLHEFLNFMHKERYKEFRNSDLFKQLCQDNRDHLDFMDVMALYYIIRSGRPFCDGCDQFIKGIYFCCIHCFDRCERNYCLCTQCLKAKKYTDRPDHRHQFLDNFTLLDLKKRDALKRAPTSKQVEETSLALVPATPEKRGKKRKWGATRKAAGKVVKIGGTVAQIGASVAQIIACGIQ